ncbi:hypothetical protein ACF0H5_022927 [Mactra antiquata]
MMESSLPDDTMTAAIFKDLLKQMNSTDLFQTAPPCPILAYNSSTTPSSQNCSLEDGRLLKSKGNPYHFRGCYNEDPKRLNTYVNDTQTYCIGIRRFDFISYTNNTTCDPSNNGTEVSFPDTHHPCRLNGTTINTLFAQISCVQVPNLQLLSIRCNKSYDEFVLEYDLVPLQGQNSPSFPIYKMSSLCDHKTANVTFISIYNAEYENNSETGTVTNCQCHLYITTTTTLTLHTYDNRLLQGQEMTLQYENMTELKKWYNEPDFKHIVDTRIITVDPQILILNWVNRSSHGGGKFWIGIEGNGSMNFTCGQNSVTMVTTQVKETTTASQDITTTSADITTTSADTTSADITTTSADNVSKGRSSQSGQTKATTTVSQDNKNSDSDSKVNIALIVGIAVGVLLFIIILIVIICCILASIKRRNRTNPEQSDANPGSQNNAETTEQNTNNIDDKENDVTSDVIKEHKSIFPPLTPVNPSNSAYRHVGRSDTSHPNRKVNKSEELFQGNEEDRAYNMSDAVDGDVNDSGTMENVHNDLEATHDDNGEQLERKAHKKKKKKKKKKHKQEKTSDELVTGLNENDQIDNDGIDNELEKTPWSNLFL